MRLSELEHELDAWTAEGLVSPEQAAAIRSRYAREAPAEARGRIVRVVSAVGAVVAGLGVILFVAANWDGMPRPTRILLLLALVAAAYGAGYVLRELRGTHPHVGEALYLLGGLAFAAEIFLVGQMYHVDAHWPLAFLAIAVLTGAVAAVVRAQALAALSLVSLGVWPLMEVVELDSDAGLYAPVAARSEHGEDDEERRRQQRRSLPGRGPPAVGQEREHGRTRARGDRQRDEGEERSPVDRGVRDLVVHRLEREHEGADEEQRQPERPHRRAEAGPREHAAVARAEPVQRGAVERGRDRCVEPRVTVEFDDLHQRPDAERDE